MDYTHNNTPQDSATKSIINNLSQNASHNHASSRAWLNDANNIFSQADQNAAKKNSWWNSMNATLNLLKQAHSVIAQSEQRIKRQAERIEILEKLSNTDELTQIANRRGFMYEVERELDRVNRDKSQGGLLIMIDLDNFKTINDTYGHDAGDAALKLVASSLNSDIRRMDVAGRLGGDEFVILFVNTSREQALERAQFLIKRLNNLSFIWQGEEIPVRASIGLKDYDKGSEADEIFHAADQSMYENKRQIKAANTKQDNKVM